MIYTDLDEGDVVGKLSDLVPLIADVVSMVVRRDYDSLVKIGALAKEDRGSQFEVRPVSWLHEKLTIDPYPGTLVEPPQGSVYKHVADGIHCITDPFDRTFTNPLSLDTTDLVVGMQWRISFRMWTEEEGRSNLCLILVIYVTPTHGIEIIIGNLYMQ